MKKEKQNLQFPDENSTDMPKPTCIPLSTGSKYTAILFAVFSAILLWGIYALSTQPIADETGKPLDPALKTLMLVLFFVVTAGMLWSCCYLFYRWIGKKGAFLLTPKGIEKGFVILSFLAFWAAIPVSYIPWEAIGEKCYNDRTKQNCYDLVPQALPQSIPSPVRLLLRICGFPYNTGKVKADQLRLYHAAVLRARGSER